MDDLDAIRDRAAAVNRRPISLRASAEFAGGFEEKAVKEVLRLIGSADLAKAMLATSRERTGKPRLSFPFFHETIPDFPVVLRASRLRFDFDGVFMQLMNDFAGTPMWSAWQDACSSREDDDDRGMGLIFSWPRVKGCKQFCVLHDAVTADWTGTRLQRLVGTSVFTIETLPSFLAGLRAAAVGDDEDDVPDLFEDEESEGGDGDGS